MLAQGAQSHAVEQAAAALAEYMVFAQNRGSKKCRPPNTRILILGTPKGTHNFGEPPHNLNDEDPKLPQAPQLRTVLSCFSGSSQQRFL